MEPGPGACHPPPPARAMTRPPCPPGRMAPSSSFMPTPTNGPGLLLHANANKSPRLPPHIPIEDVSLGRAPSTSRTRRPHTPQPPLPRLRSLESAPRLPASTRLLGPSRLVRSEPLEKRRATRTLTLPPDLPAPSEEPSAIDAPVSGGSTPPSRPAPTLFTRHRIVAACTPVCPANLPSPPAV